MWIQLRRWLLTLPRPEIARCNYSRPGAYDDRPTKTKFPLSGPLPTVTDFLRLDKKESLANSKYVWFTQLSKQDYEFMNLSHCSV